MLGVFMEKVTFIEKSTFIGRKAYFITEKPNFSVEKVQTFTTSFALLSNKIIVRSQCNSDCIIDELYPFWHDMVFHCNKYRIFG